MINDMKGYAMGKYFAEAKALLKKIEYASGLENAERILLEFQTLISLAMRSKKEKEDLPIILELQKDAKEKIATWKK